MSNIPSKFHLSIFTCFQGVLSAKFEGGVMKLMQGEDVSTLETKESFKIRDNLWGEFTTAMKYIEPSKWKDQYNTDELDTVVFDGYSWIFEYENSGIECKSLGDNAFPSFNDCSATLSTDRFYYLVLIIDALIERRHFIKLI